MGGQSLSSDQGGGIAQVTPTEAWDQLAKDPDAMLIDVRTQAEWGFVGVPDVSAIGKTLICVEWSQYPGMSKNPRFVEVVLDEIGQAPNGPLYFICRSGARSLHAAAAVSAHLAALGVHCDCINVAEGFEGDLDPQKHRGRLNGWRFRGLAWRQS